MPKKICFIHTETTGLHDLMDQKVYKKNLFGFARLVSFSWLIAERITGSDFNIIKKETFIIKPRCLVIPEECVKFHGISHEIAMKKGTEIEEVLDKFRKDITDVSIISSHGLEFHLKAVQGELVRYNKAIDFNKYLLIDTNSFNHGISPATLVNISNSYLKQKLVDKAKSIDIICNIFFRFYNDYENKIKLN